MYNGRLRELCRTHGITIEEIANSLGCSTQTVKNWDNKVHSPIEKCKAIAKSLDVPIRLLFEKDNRTAPKDKLW